MASLFRYDIEVTVEHADGGHSGVSLDYESPVKFSVGDTIHVGDQDVVVGYVCWFFDDPGRACLTMEADFVAENREDAGEWFSLFCSKPGSGHPPGIIG